MTCELDTRGLLCPLPVIRCADAIKSLADGDQLHVIASDPGTVHDIPAWCRVHGHSVLKIIEERNQICFEIEVAPE